MSHPPDVSPRTAHAGGSDGERGATWADIDQGSLMGTELVVGILLWSAIGHLADRWLSTDPWLLLVGAFVGFGGGLYLIWVRSTRMEQRDRDDREAQQAAGTSADAQRGDAREH